MKEKLKDIGAYAGLALVAVFVGYIYVIYQKNEAKRKNYKI
jgi:hypothetical protein